MITKPNPENQRAANREIYTFLLPLREQELTRLLESIKALQKDLRLILPPHSESVPAVSAADDLLKTWNDVIKRILVAKQTKETNRELRNWDNEGGAVDLARKQDSLSETTS